MSYSCLAHRLYTRCSTWPQKSFHLKTLTGQQVSIGSLSLLSISALRCILSDPWCSWTLHDRWLSRQRSTQLRAATEPLAVWMTSSAAAVWLITLITCLPCMWFQSQACSCSSSARCVKTAPTGAKSHSNKQTTTSVDCSKQLSLWHLPTGRDPSCNPLQPPSLCAVDVPLSRMPTPYFWICSLGRLQAIYYSDFSFQ